MRVSFLVLLACLCLSAVSAGKKQKQETERSSYTNQDGYAVDAEKTTKITEDTEIKTIKEGDCVEEEEVTVIRTSVNGKRKGKRKKEAVEKVQKTCDELLFAEKADCVGKTETQTCSFTIKNELNCEFECKCEEVIQEVVEETYESEDCNNGGEVKVRKVKKAGEKRKKKKVAGGRECAGEKKLSFSNCLIKMKGLVAWGENTANFDAKFDAL